MPKCRILTKKFGLKFTCAPKTFPSRSGSQLLSLWKRWWKNWEVDGFGSESSEKNIPVKEQGMMEAGRRHRVHRVGCEGEGVHAGSFQGHLPERGGQGRWDSREPCSEVLNTPLEGLVLGARKDSATGYRSHLCSWWGGDLQGLGLKVRSHLLSKLPPWPELMPQSPASVQSIYHGDHSGGPAGGARAGLQLLLCWDHTKSQQAAWPWAKSAVPLGLRKTIQLCLSWRKAT